MPFTGKEKSRATLYLGYSRTGKDFVVRSMDAVTDEDDEDQIRKMIENITMIRQSLVSGAPFRDMTFQSGGAQTKQRAPFVGRAEMEKTGRQLVSELSQYLAVPVLNDIFATGGTGASVRSVGLG